MSSRGLRTSFLLTQFVEDTGDVVFYKNSCGIAAARGVFADGSVSDSGIEIGK